MPPMTSIKITIAVDNFIALVDNDLPEGAAKSGELECWLPRTILEDTVSEDNIQLLEKKKPSKKRKAPPARKVSGPPSAVSLCYSLVLATH